MNRMQEKYNNEVVPALRKAFDLKNIMEVPRIQKVVVNIGMGEAMDNPKALDAAVGDLTQITGQKPVVTKARVSIAAAAHPQRGCPRALPTVGNSSSRMRAALRKMTSSTAPSTGLFTP